MWKFLAILSVASMLIAGFSAARGEDPSIPLRLLVSLFGVAAALCTRRALLPPMPSRSYGSAVFACPEEITEFVVARGKRLSPGSVLLGCIQQKHVALPLPFTSQHGIIVGGSGTGKSFSFFLPNMAFGGGVSCVATDPKSELWLYTSGYHRSTRFAPNDPQASSSFNWIPLCRDARLAAVCARAIVEAGETERQEAPWPDLETAFLSALFAHASTLSVPTPLTAYQLLTRSNPGDLIAMFLASASAVAREQAVIFQQTNERMRGSITPVLAAKLQWMRTPEIERFTSSTFAPPDFGRLRVLPEALYWCVREQDIALLRPLSALFFTVLLEQIAAERVGESLGNTSVPVHLYLDEFANIGIIPHYETTISLARGRGLSVWHGIQSLSQLEACYGRANAQTILTNCATKIVLHGLDVETAEYVSRSLGEETAVVARRTWQKRRLALFSSFTSDSVQEHARRLLTADEVRRIGTGQALVITGNRKPLLLDKFYYAEPRCTASVSPLGSARALPIPFPSPAFSVAMSQEDARLKPSIPDAIKSIPLPPPFPNALRLKGKSVLEHNESAGQSLAKFPARKNPRKRQTVIVKATKHPGEKN